MDTGSIFVSQVPNTQLKGLGVQDTPPSLTVGGYPAHEKHITPCLPHVVKTPLHRTPGIAPPAVQILTYLHPPIESVLVGRKSVLVGRFVA